MAAGLSKEQLNARIRSRLQKLARDERGEYAKFRASGERDGLNWEAQIAVSRASNGESFGQLRFTISDPISLDSKSFSFDSLAAAIAAFRALRGEPHNEAGEYQRLFARTRFNQVWGYRFALAPSSDKLELFDRATRQAVVIDDPKVLDQLAHALFRALRPDLSQFEHDPAWIDSIGLLFVLDDASDFFPGYEHHIVDWTPSADWRLADQYFKQAEAAE